MPIKAAVWRQGVLRVMLLLVFEVNPPPQKKSARISAECSWSARVCGSGFV